MIDKTLGYCRKIRESARKQFIIQWLKTREDRLKQEFDEVMAEFGVEYISQEEIENKSYVTAS